jgi:hypothetical protein
VEVYLHLLFFTSTYNSCSSCSGQCSYNCGTPTTSMCSSSACAGYPSCVNQAAINAGSGSWGCSNKYCYNECGGSACDSMCQKTCYGLATV